MMNILKLKAIIRSLCNPPDDVALRQMDRIEQAKMNLMIEEGKEFSLKEAISRIEQCTVYEALKKYGKCQLKAAQSLGMIDRAIRHLLND